MMRTEIDRVIIGFYDLTGYRITFERNYSGRCYNVNFRQFKRVLKAIKSVGLYKDETYYGTNGMSQEYSR